MPSAKICNLLVFLLSSDVDDEDVVEEDDDEDLRWLRDAEDLLSVLGRGFAWRTRNLMRRNKQSVP